MLIAPQDFIDKVSRLYLNDPARASSIPFWKLEGFLLESQAYEVIDGADRYLYALRGKQLVFYWSNDARRFLLPPDEVRGLDFLVLHEDFFDLVRDLLGEGYDATPGYTLFYDYSYVPDDAASGRSTTTGSDDSTTDSGRIGDGGNAGHGAKGRYYVDDFDFGREAEYESLADLINATDGAFHLTADKVRQWTKTPAFDPTLWVWVKDEDTHAPLGIGVSNHYAKMRETDLDWFYVLPAHQGKGIGRMLIKETIDRSKTRSEIIRLGGVADEFYMKCGFRRRDKWYVVRRSPIVSDGV